MNIKSNSISVEDIIEQAMKLEEMNKIIDLKAQGIITDACLICHMSHKGIIENALYQAGIKKIPIVYSPYIEDDKILMVTDKELVENIKKSIHFEI